MIISALTLQITSCFDPIEKILEKNGFIKIENPILPSFVYENQNSGISIELELAMYYSSQVPQIIEYMELCIKKSNGRLMHFEEASNYFGE